MSRRVLVTGGSSGLGRAIAGRFAAAGDRVLIADLVPPEQTTGATGYQRLDVRSEDDWRQARDRCESAWGGLDVLVNNAGVAAAGRIERVGQDDWDWILDINIGGAVRGCRTFVPLLKRQGGGHIVNIASLAALINLPGMASYNVSKAGVVALSETLRHELAPWGVRVSVVCPGFVPTNLGAGLRSPDEVLTRQAHRWIQHGAGTPELVAERVVDAVDKGRFLVLTHPRDRSAVRTRRWLPRVADGRIARMWQRTKAKLDEQDRQESAA